MAEKPRRKIRARQAKRKEPDVQLSVRSLGVERKRSDITRQVEDDVVFGVDDPTATKLTIIPTPFDMKGLNKIANESSCLPQAIDAMVANLAGYGYRAVPTEEDGEMSPEELQKLKDFVEWANSQESLSVVHRKYIHDYEKYGFGFYEVIRNRAGQVSLLRHAKSSRIRITRVDETPIPVEVTVQRGGRAVKVTERRKFRRYVQVINNVIGSNQVKATRVYFKEYGDPRRLNWRTGRFQGEDGQGRVREADLATELLHGKQISEDSYGQPRWIGQLPGILGNREAEMVNLRYFEDNTVPPLALMVSGGRLTRQSFDDLNKLLNEQGIGRDRQHQIMLIEATPETSGLDERGRVTLQMEKLASERQSDGLFKDYTDNNCAQVGSAFRLPPTLLGRSQDATFATANVSAWIAEAQVFIPERRKHDELLNKNIVNHPAGLGLQTVKLQSVGPTISNPQDIVKALTAGNVMGALTPRKAVEGLNEAMDIGIDQYPLEDEEGYEEWMDKPIQIGLREIQSGADNDGDPDEAREQQNAGGRRGSPVREETDEAGTEGSRPSREE
jgi:PBSX family phage portal protein